MNSNYRKLILIDTKINNEDFNKQIQYNKYIIIRSIENINNEDINYEDITKYLNNMSSKSLKKKNSSYLILHYILKWFGFYFTGKKYFNTSCSNVKNNNSFIIIKCWPLQSAL